MGTHSSILAWRIPWTEEPGGLQSMGSQRVGHNIVIEHAHMQSIRKPTKRYLKRGEVHSLWSEKLPLPYVTFSRKQTTIGFSSLTSSESPCWLLTTSWSPSSFTLIEPAPSFRALISFVIRQSLAFVLASQVALVVKNSLASAGDLTDMGSIPVLGRSPGGGHGNPLQYSCLENPMDRGAWQATVHGEAKSWTQLKRLSTHHWFMASTDLKTAREQGLAYNYGVQQIFAKNVY